MSCDKSTEEIMEAIGDITEDEIEEYLNAVIDRTQSAMVDALMKRKPDCGLVEANDPMLTKERLELTGNYGKYGRDWVIIGDETCK